MILESLDPEGEAGKDNNLSNKALIRTRNRSSKYGVEDLNSVAGRVTEWKRGSSQLPPLAVRREFQRVMVERPTSTDTAKCSGVNSSQSAYEKGRRELHSPAGVVQIPRGEASGPDHELLYIVTAPCFLDNECPNCNENADSKCPEAVSPRAIRRGSITHLLTNDVPVEIVGNRADVSRDVIGKHYGQRSEEVKLEQQHGYLDDI